MAKKHFKFYTVRFWKYLGKQKETLAFLSQYRFWYFYPKFFLKKLVTFGIEHCFKYLKEIFWILEIEYCHLGSLLKAWILWDWVFPSHVSKKILEMQDQQLSSRVLFENICSLRLKTITSCLNGSWKFEVKYCHLKYQWKFLVIELEYCHLKYWWKFWCKVEN